MDQNGLEQFLLGLGVASPADFVNQVQAMQRQQGVLSAATDELRGALATSQAQAAEAAQRAARAEGERGDLVKAIAGMSNRDNGLVDSRGVGQPFKFHGKRDGRGKSDQDFSEWGLKFGTFMVAKYGIAIDRVMRWAARQRVRITETGEGDREVAFDSVFGSLAEPDEVIENLETMLHGFWTYLISFTTGDALKIVKNSGHGGSLEAWRRLNNEHDPTSSMRRMSILKLVQSPPRCQSIEGLGPALEDWLEKKRQYEEYTDKDSKSCYCSEDQLVAAMFCIMPKELEDQMLLRSDEMDDFSVLYNKLISYSTTKRSMQIANGQKHSGKKDPDAMDVDALGKSKGKGGGGGSGCFTCGGAHYARDCTKGDRKDNVQ